jgi:hypothetical protein
MSKGKKSRSVQGQRKTKSAKVTEHRRKGIAKNKSTKAKKVRMPNEKIADAYGI